MNKEEWRPVVGYEGIYEVSDMGNVKSKERLRLNGRRHKERILKTPLNSSGRRIVSLYNNNKSKSFHPYQLVAAAFLGKEDGIVCHKNGDRTDDKLSNLYYGTHAQNTQDSIKHGTIARGERNGCSILTQKQVCEIKRRHKRFCSQNGTTSLAKEYKVSVSTISSIVNGVNWSYQYERKTK